MCAGERSLAAVQRELQQALGISTSDQDSSSLVAYRRGVAVRATYIDRRFNDVDAR